MNKIHRRGKKNHPRLYVGTRYPNAGKAKNPPKCISIKSYAEKYYATRDQVVGMVSRGELCAVTFKKKLFVLDVKPEGKCKFLT